MAVTDPKKRSRNPTVTDQGSSKCGFHLTDEMLGWKVAIPRTDQGSSKGQDRRRLARPDAHVAIPPYRSGKFQVFTSHRMPFGLTGRNPTVQIREVPSRNRIPCQLSKSDIVASHRTDQGSSKVCGLRSPLGSPRSVAIPPYRSGKFQARLSIDVQWTCPQGRNPTVQIREVPRWLRGRLKDLGAGMAVAIPPYRSGKFQVPRSFPMVLPSTTVSQSHRTDQGSSKRVNRLTIRGMWLAMSQSHRTDQGSSKAASPTSRGCGRSRSRNPTVQIREVPRMIFADFNDSFERMYRRNPTVQIREVPRISKSYWRSTQNLPSRNPTVQIREVPRATVPTV